jgi:hypothetical protein
VKRDCTKTSTILTVLNKSERQRYGNSNNTRGQGEENYRPKKTRSEKVIFSDHKVGDKPAQSSQTHYRTTSGLQAGYSKSKKQNCDRETTMTMILSQKNDDENAGGKVDSVMHMEVSTDPDQLNNDRA